MTFWLAKLRKVSVKADVDPDPAVAVSGFIFAASSVVVDEATGVATVTPNGGGGGLPNVSQSKLLGRITATTGPAEEIGLGAGLEFSGFTLRIQDAAVSLAKVVAIAASTILGNATVGSASPQALTPDQVVAMLPVFGPSGPTTHARGLVPDPGVTAGSSKYLCEDGNWTTPAGSFTPPGGGDDGKVVYASGGSITFASTIKTDGSYFAFGGVDTTLLTVGTNRYAHNTHIVSGLALDGTTNVDLVQWGVGTNNKFQLGSSNVAVSEVTGKQIKLTGVATVTNNGASFEVSDVIIDLAQTKTWDAGAIATQRAVRIAAPTYAFASASTITTTATVAISGAPVAGGGSPTFTQALALWLESGALGFGSSAALTGLVRVAHNTQVIVGRSSTSTDVNLLRWGTTTDQLIVGDDGAASAYVYAGTSFNVRLGGATKWAFTATQLDCNSGNVVNLTSINGTRVANGVLATLADGNEDLSIAGGSVYEQHTLSANCTKKLLVTGGVTALHVISIRRFTTAAFTLTIADEAGNSLYVFPAGAKGQADFVYDAGTNKFKLIGHIPLS